MARRRIQQLESELTHITIAELASGVKYEKKDVLEKEQDELKRLYPKWDRRRQPR